MPCSCFAHLYRFRDSNRKNQSILLITSHGLHFPRDLFSWVNIQHETAGYFFKENFSFVGSMLGGLFERMINFMAHRNSLCQNYLLIFLYRLKQILLQLGYRINQQQIIIYIAIYSNHTVVCSNSWTFNIIFFLLNRGITFSWKILFIKYAWKTRR